MAVTVILSAAAYPWITSMMGDMERPPVTAMRHVDCDTRRDAVTVHLSSGGPLSRDEVKALLFNRTTDEQEAAADPLDPAGGAWSAGEYLRIAGPGEPDPSWDAPLRSQGGLADGGAYVLEFTHFPTQAVFSSILAVC